MNLVNGAALTGPQLIKKQEDLDDRGGGKDIKPVRTTLNRVPRQSPIRFPIARDVNLSLSLSRCLRESLTFSPESPDSYNMMRRVECL